MLPYREQIDKTVKRLMLFDKRARKADRKFYERLSGLQRKIDEYVAYNRANNMFFDEHTDAALQKAREKLSMRVADVQAAEERLKLKIKQIKENVL